MKLLVVDDNADDVDLLRFALNRVGAVDITPIQSGQLALQLLSAQEHWPFDLIVIDWRLPGISGEQVAGAFLNSPAVQAQIPVVVLSSSLPRHVSDRLHESGAAVLQKPLDLEGFEHLANVLFDLAKNPKSNGSYLRTLSPL